MSVSLIEACCVVLAMDVYESRQYETNDKRGTYMWGKGATMLLVSIMLGYLSYRESQKGIGRMVVAATRWCTYQERRCEFKFPDLEACALKMEIKSASFDACAGEHHLDAWTSCRYKQPFDCYILLS